MKEEFIMRESLVSRFLDYVKINTRSDATSDTVPSTACQTDFAMRLVEDLKALGIEHVTYYEKNGFVIAMLPSNIDQEVAKIGFIAHMDTADFESEHVSPKIVKDYDGISDIILGEAGTYRLRVEDFPQLKNYAGDTLITTDGTTLLGADDKAGIVEIFEMLQYFIHHPEVAHGEIWVAFGPDEEIGRGADLFDPKDFPVDFAYTVDGGPIGELQYETFNGAYAHVTIQGKNVHPGTAKDTMINALQIAIDFHNLLPQNEVPEHTTAREGFYHLMELEGTVEEAQMHYIIRDHDRDIFNKRKQQLLKNAEWINDHYDEPRILVEMTDQYYNMGEVIEKDMRSVYLAEKAMKHIGITPIIEPVRGGTDGSKISFLGIPTPNLFAGGENMHGRFEFISVQTMEAAVDTLIHIVTLNASLEANDK